MTPQWVLGIDVGQKKTGIAIGQTLTGTAQPLAFIRQSVETLQSLHFSSFVTEWKASCIVIGLPQTADGEEHPLQDEILRLGQTLQEDFGLPVYYMDETLSSHEARQRFGKRKEYDSAAAAVMVETFINDRNCRIEAPFKLSLKRY